MKNKIYILVTMWYEVCDDEPNIRNVCNSTIFTSFDKAEAYLIENWASLHEHWNNAATIRTEIARDDGIYIIERNETVFYLNSSSEADALPIKMETPKYVRRLRYD